MEQVKREDAERFARVWQRVMPEGNGAILPVPPEEAVGTEGLPAPLTEAAALLGREQALQREARRLWRRTGGQGFACLVRSSGERARRFTGAAFLVTGTRPLPPRCGGRPCCGLPALYQTLLALEDGYRALMERAEDPVLAALYDALAAECQGDRRLVVRLAAGQRG